MGHRVVTSTFMKVVLSTSSAMLYSLTYVMVGATTKNHYLQAVVPRNKSRQRSESG